MSCENFVFPVDHVGLPDKKKFVQFHVDVVDRQYQKQRIGPKDETLDEKEEEKSGKDDTDLDYVAKKRPVQQTRGLSVSESKLYERSTFPLE